MRPYINLCIIKYEARYARIYPRIDNRLILIATVFFPFYQQISIVYAYVYVCMCVCNTYNYTLKPL